MPPAHSGFFLACSGTPPAAPNEGFQLPMTRHTRRAGSLRSERRASDTIRRIARPLTALASLCWLLAAVAGAGDRVAAQERGPIYGAEVNGIVTSVTVDYLRRGLRLAESADATALILTMGSSGGVLRDARPFATEIARAKVPVVVFVTPSGTDTGAVGALFLSAAHISAMAPGTSFGSPYPLTRVDEALSEQTRDLVLDSVASQLRRWNGDRGRNTEWVDRAVREGAVLNNEQAAGLQPPAIDLVAASRDELLTLLEGRTVTLEGGGTRTLAIAGRAVTDIRPSLWESLRFVLADPTVAFVLLVLGSLAVYLEFASPGTTLFAGIGLVMLAGAALGLLVLPLTWWALGLILLAFLTIGADLFVSSHGGLTVVGVAMLIIGGLNLIDTTQAPGVGVAGWSVGVVAAALATAALGGLYFVLRSRRRPVSTGQEALIGSVGDVRERLDPEGMVFVEGALWQAVSETGTIDVGEWVRVVGRHHLRLLVRRLDESVGQDKEPEEA